MKRVGVVVSGLAVALLLTVLLLGGYAQAQDVNGVPQPGTVVNMTPVTVLSSRAITTDQNTAALDISRYNGGDLFVTVDVAADSALTTTLQFAGDSTGFANAYWYATTDAGAMVSNPYRIIQTADGSSYIKAAYAGLYGRLNLDVTGTVTVTAILVQRNN